MLLDIVPLPNRTYGGSDVFSTKLPPPDDKEYNHQIGRTIPLKLFQSNNVKKYKAICVNGQTMVERIFLSYEELTLDSYKEGIDIYPLQCKCWNVNSYCTIKYRNGISNFIFENVMNKNNPFLNHQDIDFTTTNDLRYLEILNTVISCPDFDKTNISRKSTIDIANIWTDKETCISLDKLGKPELIGRGSTLLSQLESVEQNTHLFDNNPIDGNWCMYRLIEYLNSLPYGNVSVDIYRDSKTGIDAECRFEDVFSIASDDNDFDEVTLIDYVKDVGFTRYIEEQWTELTVEKTWSEEIFIVLYKGDEIIHVSYIDLIPFILGTIRLY